MSSDTSNELPEIISPMTYSLLDFRSIQAQTHLHQYIDPNNTFQKVKIDFKGDRIREFYWKRILKDLESSKTTTDLSANITKVYETLSKTNAFKHLAITFEPEEEGVVKVTFDPQYARRPGYSLIHTHLLESFGFVGSLVFRNPTGMLDNISLNYIKGTYGNLKNGYFLSYLLPIFHKDYSLEISGGRQAFFLNRSITEDSAFQTLRFFNNRTSFQLTHSQRWNIIDSVNHSKQVLDQDIFPGRKLAISASRVWPIVDPNKTWANVVQLKGSLASIEGAGEYMKKEFVSHAIFYPRFLKLTGRLSEICLENHLACGIVYPLFKSKLKMNDRFYRADLPGFSEILNPETGYDKNLHPNAGNAGFEFLGDYKGDDIFLKNTVKIDFKECPILDKAGIVPFLYLSYGYFSGDIMTNWMKEKPKPAADAPKETGQFKKKFASLSEEIKKKSRMSVGIGLFRTINFSYNFEGLLNLYTVGTASDKLARFQLRLTLNE